MSLGEKIDAWYEGHEGLTALIVLAILAGIVACVPGAWRDSLLTGAAAAFCGGLAKLIGSYRGKAEMTVREPSQLRQ